MFQDHKNVYFIKYQIALLCVPSTLFSNFTFQEELSKFGKLLIPHQLLSAENFTSYFLRKRINYKSDEFLLFSRPKKGLPNLVFCYCHSILYSIFPINKFFA